MYKLKMILSGLIRHRRRNIISCLLLAAVLSVAFCGFFYKSYALKQRIGVAEPSLLIADEPTGNLDKSTAKVVMETLTEAGRGKTVFMITHNEELTAYADEVYHLRAGVLE